MKITIIKFEWLLQNIVNCKLVVLDKNTWNHRILYNRCIKNNYLKLELLKNDYCLIEIVT